MAKKFYLICDNDKNQEIIRDSKKITIKGNHLTILEANFISDEDINQKNSEYINWNSKKLKIKIKPFFMALADSAVYITVCAYLMFFIVGAFKEDINNVICFFLASLSLVYAILDYVSVKYNFEMQRKTKWYIIVLLITIVLTFIASTYESNWFRNSFSNAISGILLLIMFFQKLYLSVKENYMLRRNPPIAASKILTKRHN